MIEPRRKLFLSFFVLLCLFVCWGCFYNTPQRGHYSSFNQRADTDSLCSVSIAVIRPMLLLLLPLVATTIVCSSSLSLSLPPTVEPVRRRRDPGVPCALHRVCFHVTSSCSCCRRQPAASSPAAAVGTVELSASGLPGEELMQKSLGRPIRDGAIGVGRGFRPSLWLLQTELERADGLVQTGATPPESAIRSFLGEFTRFQRSASARFAGISLAGRLRRRRLMDMDFGRLNVCRGGNNEIGCRGRGRRCRGLVVCRAIIDLTVRRPSIQELH